MRYEFETVRGQVMALIDDQMSISADHVIDSLLDDEALNQRDVDLPVAFASAAPASDAVPLAVSRNWDRRSTHCSSNCCRCTSTSVLTPTRR